MLIAITKTTQKCQNSTELDYLIMIQQRYSKMHYGKCTHAIKYGRDEWAHVKVQTNLNCHSREQHVKGHCGETIPEDEKSYESYFDVIIRGFMFVE